MGDQYADERRDEDLLVAMAEGDRGALAELYARHAPWLPARLGDRCSARDLVDQAVQDTFVAVWRKPTAYRGGGEVAAWFWGIGIRRLIDQLRRQRRMPALRPSREQVLVSAEDEALLAVEHGWGAAALEGLSPELRAVVQATVLDGLTTREAARLLGIPSGTVKTRMMRARQQMREALT